MMVTVALVVVGVVVVVVWVGVVLRVVVEWVDWVVVGAVAGVMMVVGLLVVEGVVV